MFAFWKKDDSAAERFLHEPDRQLSVGTPIGTPPGDTTHKADDGHPRHPIWKLGLKQFQARFQNFF
jgi:hypothetical protein